MKSNGSRKHSARAIQLSAADLLASLRSHADHLEGCRQLTLRVTRLALPMPAPVIRPREIGAIRAQLRVSQPVFARLLNVPVATARSWEQGKRTPSGAALRLLDIARRNPEVLVASP